MPCASIDPLKPPSDAPESYASFAASDHGERTERRVQPLPIRGVCETAYVGSLSLKTNKDDIRKLFPRYGAVHLIKLTADACTGSPAGSTSSLWKAMVPGCTRGLNVPIIGDTFVTGAL